ncbi:conserved hypothetical protein [Culex quinquefasciatus]|uniref:Uncharacterized protein n=1 Tax=Culex quinquefasciatus TaxID=7176 RepID=B0X2I4_CULQU|nr:conserved hypothetical protein [Culex quinquefasciatus]|eukprot:XP_001863856.1 conserved hypothetical protein [Culex quinquefasciatus]
MSIASTIEQYQKGSSFERDLQVDRQLDLQVDRLLRLVRRDSCLA